jgi:energy-converting hydrogenase Eha subunit C
LCVRLFFLLSSFAFLFSNFSCTLYIIYIWHSIKNMYVDVSSVLCPWDPFCVLVLLLGWVLYVRKGKRIWTSSLRLKR